MRSESDGFGTLHSALVFAYYAAVLCVTMLVLHPAYLLVSGVGAALYYAALAGWRSLLRCLLWILPLMLIAVGINLAFNHRGVTALWYFRNGNAVTLESLVFGLCAAGMLAAAVLWFLSFHRVLTSDKLMAITGRFAPALSLLFSMTLRFVPRQARHEARHGRGKRAARRGAPGRAHREHRGDLGAGGRRDHG